MNPIEKAKELFDKYHYQICNDNGMSENESSLMCARNCVLIVVDEMIYFLNDHWQEFFSWKSDIKFWEDVKSEINKLT